MSRSSRGTEGFKQGRGRRRLGSQNPSGHHHPKVHIISTHTLPRRAGTGQTESARHQGGPTQAHFLLSRFGFQFGS